MSNNVEITRGRQSGVIESAVEMQSRYYARTPGFNEDYGTNLAKKLAELEARLGDEQTDVWSAKYQDKIVGTILIDGDDVGQNRARLTSFIVDEAFRGVGTGRRLLTEAIDFVDSQGFEETHLWTFEGSDAARHLYESVGFTLEKEVKGEFFGKQLTAQLFVRRWPGTIE